MGRQAAWAQRADDAGGLCGLDRGAGEAEVAAIKRAMESTQWATAICANATPAGPPASPEFGTGLALEYGGDSASSGEIKGVSWRREGFESLCRINNLLILQKKFVPSCPRKPPSLSTGSSTGIPLFRLN